MSDWDALRMLRWTGKKPKLPVFVTSNPVLPERLAGLGCMVIVHDPGEPMPFGLLQGLDVIMWFDECDKAAGVWEAMSAKKQLPASFAAWCACGAGLTRFPSKCLRPLPRQIEQEDAA